MPEIFATNAREEESDAARKGAKTARKEIKWLALYTFVQRRVFGKLGFTFCIFPIEREN